MQDESPLTPFQITDWRAVRANQALSLSPKLATLAYDLVGFSTDPEESQLPQWDMFWITQKQAASKKFTALAPEERQVVFTALFPKIADELEAAYSFLPKTSYMNVMAFRFPNSPEDQHEQQAIWIRSIIENLGSFDENMAWIIQWLHELSPWQGREMSILLAAIVEQGNEKGEQLFQALLATATDQQSNILFGRYVIQTLLMVDRPEGWDAIERLLLAAQRQEGLRQSILEEIPLAHPEAFRRMCSLLIDENLLRFSSVLHAFNGWFDFRFDVDERKKVQFLLTQAHALLNDRAYCHDSVDASNPEICYLALCTLAFEDVDVALPHAVKLLQHPSVHHRLVAIYFLSHLKRPAVSDLLFPVLIDTDQIVSAAALSALISMQWTTEHPDFLRQLISVIDHFPPKAQRLTSPLWSWHTISSSQALVADTIIDTVSQEMLSTIYPYICLASVDGRSRLLSRLGEKETLLSDDLTLVVTLIGDKSGWVRDSAYNILRQLTLSPSDAPILEAYLSRKAESLRQNILALLLRLPDDEEVLASADRLLAQSKSLQRQAGLELLATLVNKKRAVESCRQRAHTYQDGLKSQADPYQQQLLEKIGQREKKTFTLVDGLGLFNPTDRTQPPTPQPHHTLFKRGWFGQSKARSCAESLERLIDQHADEPVTIGTWQEQESEELLGNLSWGFDDWFSHVKFNKPPPDLPLSHIWLSWWQNHSQSLGDEAPFILLQLLAGRHEERRSKYYYSVHTDAVEPLSDRVVDKISNTLYARAGAKAAQWRYPTTMKEIFLWLLLRQPPSATLINKLLDAVEHSLFLVNEADSARRGGWRRTTGCFGWMQTANLHQNYCGANWSDAQTIRLWQLHRWYDEPGIDSLPRERPDLGIVMRAYHAGGAGQADILDHLIGQRSDPGQRHSFTDLCTASQRKPDSHENLFVTDPLLQEAIQRCRERIIEVEAARGEMETVATGAALALQYTGGPDVLARLLQALSGSKIKRNSAYSRDDTGRGAVLAQLVQGTLPGMTESVAQVRPLLSKLKLTDKQWIEIALYAPQWATHIEAVLGWPGLADATWWFHAHIKDARWEMDEMIKKRWTGQIAQRTPLTDEERVDGAVDVAWFHLTHRILGDTRWQQISNAAKFVCSGSSHTRAKLFADAMRGQIEANQLVNRIDTKRHQDSVRALGLLPLPVGAEREQRLYERYLTCQQFLQSGRKFGAQRRASEKLAVEICMKNLAHTAGYADPLRLQWAMERHAVADLAQGSVTVTVNKASISLQIDALGEPQIDVVKNGRTLKAIPKGVKKAPEVAALVNRKQEIAQQAKRMRLSLEQAMCRGDRFEWGELLALLQHPVLSPMLDDLLFVIDGQIGAIGPERKTLQNVSGQAFKMQDNTPLRLAHPHDLLLQDEWHLWQRECFLQERIQPFKQIFRELYVVTPAEREAITHSQRYAGQQVQYRQATALLRQRGWLTDFYSEEIHRSYHSENLIVWLNIAGGWHTPVALEGMTLDTVYFTRRDSWKPIALEEVPPRLFSEAMRDLDLVVSVAHQGGVDPESTASTQELRASLVRETAKLLGLEQVKVRGSHVLIDGSIGNYSVHLSSGVVHQRPGNYVCIVPVHAQHRGRLFLPFVDDDPKSAEILSKVVLLAHDHMIKDPTILEQIRRK